jgi:hypothetical protein
MVRILAHKIGLGIACRPLKDMMDWDMDLRQLSGAIFSPAPHYASMNRATWHDFLHERIDLKSNVANGIVMPVRNEASVLRMLGLPSSRYSLLNHWCGILHSSITISGKH